MGFLLQPPLVRWKPFAQVSPVLIIKVFRSSGRPRGAKGQEWPFLARRLQSIVTTSCQGMGHEVRPPFPAPLPHSSIVAKRGNAAKLSKAKHLFG